jgi:Tol biopolymer transport system component
MRRCLCSVVGLVLFSAIGPVTVGAAGALPDSTGATTRVSVKNGGGQAAALGSAGAGQPAVSENGFAVAFVSDATNLVAGDTNGVSDVFVNQGGTIARVSLGANFAEANGPSSAPALSGDGRYVAFTSAADNLVPGDDNDALDVFVYDRQQSTITRVSVASDGTQGNGDSRSPSIDRTGTVVAFTSAAGNLVAGDDNGHNDVFVHRLGPSPTTTLVSGVADGSGPGDGASDEPSLSRDGTVVAFSSEATDLVAGDGNGHKDVFRRLIDPDSATELVSLRNGSTTVAGDGDSSSPSVSADGSQIAFASDATNLRSASDDNDVSDVFLRTPQSKSTVLMSQSCGGDAADDASSAPHISSDTGSGGAGVSFVTDAENLLQGCAAAPAPDNNNLPDVYFRPLGSAPIVNERVSRDPAGAQFNRPSLESAVSGDGRLVAFTTGAIEASSGGPGAGSEVYGRDRGTNPGTTTRLSAPAGGPALGPAVTQFPAISADGRIVVYASGAPDLVTDDSNNMTDVFVSDRGRNETALVSRGLNGAAADGPSAVDSAPAISADGQLVAFSSSATNLVAGDNNGVGDVFVYDRARKEMSRVSVGAGGAEATGRDSFAPALSGDGRYVAFASDAANLVADDTNNATDVFIYDRQVKTTTRVSVGPGGVQADGGESYAPALSADNTVVAFVSRATNLAPGATDGGDSVFVRDLKAGTTTRVGGAGDPEGFEPAATLSADGRFVAYPSAAAGLVPGDTNNAVDVFVFDRQAGTTERVSVGPGGAQGDRPSTAPAISADGRFVAFQSAAANLIPTDTNHRTDVFIRDRRLGSTTRVSLGPSSVQGDQPSTGPQISANGRFVAFESLATNLVPGDTNSAPDVFVHDLTPVRGYWLVAADGGIFAYGSAVFAGSTGAIKLAKPIVALAPTPTGHGYWLVASDGGVFAFGDARFFGSTGSIRLARPIVGMAPTPTGKGYWLVASDGGIFAFGDAAFFGSTGTTKLAQPIVGMAPTPTGKGYWLVARDGGIFAFGDAAFAGSTGAIKLAQPIVGMAPTPAGGGYWLVGSDGGIFAFGDARFFGSTGAMKLNKPIVGLAPSPTGGGYWLAASDGGTFAFGDATFFGSAGAMKLAQPIVGMAARP